VRYSDGVTSRALTPGSAIARAPLPTPPCPLLTSPCPLPPPPCPSAPSAGRGVALSIWGTISIEVTAEACARHRRNGTRRA